MGQRYPVQAAQPLTAVPVLKVDGWVAVKDAALTFEVACRWRSTATRRSTREM